ncbi:MAG: molybdopterin-dependent oxidoreductase [Longimicrobiales bacterium]
MSTHPHGGGPLETIRITVNGKRLESRVEPRLLLVQYLRDVLDLTGAHVGCDSSQCGACTVILDGDAVKSCTLFAVQADGSNVETIEGLGGDDAMHPLQRAFLDESATQCGFCTPGMIMAAEALLRRTPDPTESEIRRGLEGNLCRCTGYRSIIAAVQRAAQRPRTVGDTHGEFSRATRFVTGRGAFADDDRSTRRVFAAFVRSPHAHARILAIDVRQALAIPGVAGAWTGRDLEQAGIRPIPAASFVQFAQVGHSLQGLHAPDRMPLATDKVRHVGEPVAIVVAENEHVARDAADRIEVEYSALPAVGDAMAALLPGAPVIHDAAENNIAVEWATGDAGAVAAAFASAAHVVEQHITIPRTAAVPLEPRACTANYDPATRSLTLRSPTQVPHVQRMIQSAVLGIPESHVRIIAGDMGGAFGSRISPAPEDLAVCFASMQLGRPVHWAGNRREAFHTDGQGRDHVLDVVMALDSTHHIMALRLRSVANLGAWAGLLAPALPTIVLGEALAGPYAVPAVDARVTAVFTNTAPVDAVRGAGRQEACFALERLLDTAARQLGIEPEALRRRALENGTSAGRGRAARGGATSSSGNASSAAARAALERALEVAGVPRLRSEQQKLREQGRYMGIGIAVYTDAHAPGPGYAIAMAGAAIGLFGRAVVRVHPTGSVTVHSDAPGQGQDHETTFARIVTDVLGVDAGQVAVLSGDTAAAAASAGTFLGRGAGVSARAVRLAAGAVRTRAVQIAAHQFGVDDSQIEQKGTTFRVRGRSDCQMRIDEIARLAQAGAGLPDGVEHDLEAAASFDAAEWSRTTGVHIAIAEVDAETGNAALLRYVAVDDAGHVLEPQIVRGMLEGGIAHGIGQALMEQIVYDENGQLLTASLMDYALPRAHDMPAFDIRPQTGDRDDVSERDAGARSATGAKAATAASPVTAHAVRTGANPAVRSAGSAGTIAAPAAVANAVLDALAPIGVTSIDLPLTPARIWEAIRLARGGD